MDVKDFALESFESLVFSLPQSVLYEVGAKEGKKRRNSGGIE